MLTDLNAGRAAALTGGGFVLGTILGAVIQNWLRVDIVPLGVSYALTTELSVTTAFTLDLLQCGNPAAQRRHEHAPGRAVLRGATWHHAELQLAWRTRGRAQHPGPVVRMHVCILKQRDECCELSWV